MTVRNRIAITAVMTLVISVVVTLTTLIAGLLVEAGEHAIDHWR